MEENSIIIQIPEAKIDFKDANWKEIVKKDFQELQNALEKSPNTASPAYYTWFWFFMRYSRALCSAEGRKYLQDEGLTPFTFVKEVVGLNMSGGGAYTIGFKFFEECLKNTHTIDVHGISFRIKERKYELFSNSSSLQQIFYGAPGTGKSHTVKTETEAWEERGRVVRTTFHPDSDYSTFVGAYKPTTESVQRYDIYNKPMTRDGVPVMEQIITYEFVGQAFLQAYIDAWKNREEPEFLIIEEINRGNCAQIFGDLFQLLDRGDDGYSEYAIKADKDLQKHLSKAFKEVEIEDFPNVKAGKELLLPNNLYIRATMNTSDQSLFPIDSAFKRRWDWKYRPISNAQLGWKIEADGMLYDWWEFLERINREIGTTTNSEDKKLGYFFCKAKEGRISAETFVGKVVFYLWNDVFKDYELSNSFFDDGEGGKLTFDKFYFVEDNETRIAEESISLFLSNLGVEAEESVENEEESENEPDDTTPLTTFFVYNGEEIRSKSFITSMEELVKRIGPAEVREVVGKSLVITKEEIDVLSGKPDRERALSHPLGDNLFLRAHKNNANHRKLIQKVKDALKLDLEIVHG